ncbi:MAG: DNA polymerase III subunit chi [Ramlibacter sp.]
MTAIEFHFNAPDRLSYACRLLRKAVGKGARLVVTGEGGLLRELDTTLWTFSPLEFVPHCHGQAAPDVLAASPVVLTEAVHDTPHHQVLVNLGGPVPEGFERFERLIEVVTLDEDDRQAARGRWKHYADRGYAIRKNDLALKEQA